MRRTRPSPSITARAGLRGIASSSMREIAILGPGGVGGFLAGALERAGTRVTIVARGPRAAAIERDGIRVQSVLLGDFSARPRAAPEYDADRATLVVATKATGLEAALDRIEGEPELVVPMLNGLDHLDTLRARFGTRAVAASIRIESERPRAGLFVQTSPFLRIDAASADSTMASALQRFAATMTAAEVATRILD